ncbi:hypothetical protein [Pseudovibrio sp. FO-BEG1]|uniref:hypothetical protein n=1 Tax=Pseudovibrio sp. (strain FO-BEG1) TaxID=911045 RepID=UPI001AD9118A|nr:hypothetical protein [Pseudovibrio sp. FO-BEG1]
MGLMKLMGTLLVCAHPAGQSLVSLKLRRIPVQITHVLCLNVKVIHANQYKNISSYR